MTDQRQFAIHDLLQWWPRPEPGPDPALFVLFELLREQPRAVRELAALQLELSKEVHMAQVKAIDRALSILPQTK
jgi:hypothetical protein